MTRRLKYNQGPGHRASIEMLQLQRIIRTVYVSKAISYHRLHYVRWYPFGILNSCRNVLCSYLGPTRLHGMPCCRFLHAMLITLLEYLVCDANS